MLIASFIFFCILNFEEWIFYELRIVFVKLKMGFACILVLLARNPFFR